MTKSLRNTGLKILGHAPWAVSQRKDAAEEGIATDNLFSPNFGVPTAFMDPRRAMIGIRLNLGR